MIEIQELTKVYGGKTAVTDLTFTVRPGVVTGFLGPNGAGKSTTMRAILGLDHPTRGQAVVQGRRYAEHPAPMSIVGALLESSAHPGRSPRNHLRALAATHGIGRRRVDEVIAQVGLTEVAGKRVGGFSLGMGQRLGIAVALLGEPAVLILDEPVNGLDPDGIRWIRGLLRGLAAEGRTVFVSSHLMSEMALTADHLIVIGRGRLLADVSIAELTASSEPSVRVQSPRAGELAGLLAGPGVTVTAGAGDSLTISGLSSAAIAEEAFAAGIVLHDVTTTTASLEDAYLALVQQHTEFQAIPVSTPGRAAA
ncbi:MAG TPA: ATP-binding cassette domain-containing protein [Propionibacteriaceae bacterium]|nr:ATP-binding cassette domain-containing protein [Propionibacteriaceae bacterium]